VQAERPSSPLPGLYAIPEILARAVDDEITSFAARTRYPKQVKQA